jgi:hypothetical protein
MNRQLKLTDATQRDTIVARGKERMFSHSHRQVGGGMAAAQAQTARLIADRMSGLNSFQRAYLETLTTLAAWRVAQDCQAQVAHWVIEGLASHADLVQARDVAKKAHKAYQSARARYLRLSSLVAVQAGTLAGSRAAAAYLGNR